MTHGVPIKLPTYNVKRLRHIAAVLAMRDTKQDVAKAAILMGVTRDTLYRLLQREPDIRRESAEDPRWCKLMPEEKR